MNSSYPSAVHIIFIYIGVHWAQNIFHTAHALNNAAKDWLLSWLETVRLNPRDSVSRLQQKKGSCRFSSYLAFIWQQCYGLPMFSFLYHCFNYLSLARSFRTNGIGKLKVTLIEGVDLISSDPNGEF